MAATYVQVDAGEMERVMVDAGFHPVVIPGTAERVYQRGVVRRGGHPVLDLAVRIYSSVPTYGGEARGCGEDAIRVLLVHVTSGKIVWSATRTHRTRGWRERMLQRMRDAWAAAREVPPCPMCSIRPMTLRRTRDRSRRFFSCVGFPTCRGTRSEELAG